MPLGHGLSEEAEKLHLEDAKYGYNVLHTAGGEPGNLTVLNEALDKLPEDMLQTMLAAQNNASGWLAG